MTSTPKDLKFMAMARNMAELMSKDKSAKVGSIIFGTSDEILSTGWNGFPRNVNDDVPERHERPLKYQWTEHAERNAYYNAARCGHSLLGGRMYSCVLPTCPDCARGAIQVGLSAIYLEASAFIETERSKPWIEAWNNVSKEMLCEAGIEIFILSTPKETKED